MSASTCRTCPERLSGCVMVECARCGRVLCKKKDDPYNVEGVGVVCEECYFDLCDCGFDVSYRFRCSKVVECVTRH